jgi:hypothetical protein
MSNAVVALGLAVLALASLFGAVKGWQHAPRSRSPHRFRDLPLLLRVFVLAVGALGLIGGVVLAQEVGSARFR